MFASLRNLYLWQMNGQIWLYRKMPTADSVFGVDFVPFFIFDLFKIKWTNGIDVCFTLDDIFSLHSEWYLWQRDWTEIEVSVRTITRNWMSERSKVIQNVDLHQSYNNKRPHRTRLSSSQSASGVTTMSMTPSFIFICNNKLSAIVAQQYRYRYRRRRETAHQLKHTHIAPNTILFTSSVKIFTLEWHACVQCCVLHHTLNVFPLAYYRMRMFSCVRCRCRCQLFQAAAVSKLYWRPKWKEWHVIKA